MARDESSLNPLREGEVNAGPAVGQEHRVERSLAILYGIVKVVTIVPKVLEVIRHNQQLLSDTGPRRTTENSNDRRRKWLKKKGIK